MASTYSTSLRLELIGTGEQQGTWGSTTNTNLGTLLEEAIGGYTSVTVADAGDTTLTTNNGSADQARNMVLNFSGTLSAARNVICPAVEKVYIVANNTTGGHAVTLKTSGGSGISVAAGSTAILFCDGTNVRAAFNGTAPQFNTIELGNASDTTLSRVSAGVVAVEGKNVALNGTTEVLTTGSIELGAASDTTITRSAAGVIAVEGGVIPKENRQNDFSAGGDQYFNGIQQRSNNDYQPQQLATHCGATAGSGGYMILQRARGTISSPSNINSGDTLGQLYFAGYHGGNFRAAAAITAVTDGASADPQPGALIFQSGGNTERMRLTSAGNFGINGVPSEIFQVNARNGSASKFVLSEYDSASGGANRNIDAGITAYNNDGYAGGLGIRYARGTGGSPSVPQVNDIIYGLGGGWWDGTQFTTRGSIEFHLDAASSGSGSAPTAIVFVTGDGSLTPRMRISSAGEVNIASGGTFTDNGAYNLQCNGTAVWGAGAYVNGSDERIKDDIAPLGDCLGIVNSLQPITYRYKDTWSSDQNIQPGFVAQQLVTALAGQPYVDGVVQQGPEYLSVAYQNLIPILTKALQEANAKIDALEARVTALEDAQ